MGPQTRKRKLKTMSLKSAVLKGYKQLFKTSKLVFAGDNQAIEIAEKEIRNAFRANMEEKDTAKIEYFVNEIRLADEFARENLLQAYLGDDGHYHATVENRHVIGSSKGGLDEEGCCKTK